MSADIGERGIRRGGDGKDADRETIEAVREIDRVARANQHQDGEPRVQPVQVRYEPFEEGNATSG